MYFTDDPIADYERYSARQEAELQKYPECCECGERITDEKLVYIEGEFMHLSCFKENYVKYTDDFVGA